MTGPCWARADMILIKAHRRAAASCLPPPSFLGSGSAELGWPGKRPGEGPGVLGPEEGEFGRGAHGLPPHPSLPDSETG